MEKVRIMVVDDEYLVCDAFEKFLTLQGYEVKTAQDGEKAQEICRTFTPHLVFLDVILPGESGIKVLQRLHEIDKTISIVMISGLHDLGIAKEAILLGAADYITKPIEFEYLNQYLQDQLREFLE